jgi:hypothetical protein
MRLFLLTLPLLCGCPKKDMKSIDELERERQLEELLDDDDELFDDLPEAGEEEDEE